MTQKEARKRWRRVEMEELRRIWTDLQARRVWYNGCTEAELQRLYGADNIRHRFGHGWYKLTAL